MRRLAVLLTILLTAEAASAQTGSIGGFVVAGGKRVRGATVIAQSAVMQGARSTRSIRRGTYWLPALPAGLYDVTFSLAGHQTVTRRAQVKEGEQTRLDCTLEASADEESVTRTGLEVSVSERPQLAWTLDEDVAAALPLGREAGDELAIAPDATPPLLTRVDGVITRAPLALHRDATRGTTVVFGAPAADTPEATRVFVTPRRGGEETTTVRSTITRADDRSAARHEVSFGAPLTEDLWTFVSASGTTDQKTLFGNADVMLTERDSAAVTLIASDLHGAEPFGVTWTHSRERFTVVGSAGNTLASLSAFALLPGSHEVAAGVEHLDENVFANNSRTSGFVRDRWTPMSRVVIDAGFRMTAGTFEPRAGAVVEAWNGFKLAAAWSRIFEPFAGVESDELMLSVARPIAGTTYARAAFVSSDGPAGRDALLLDAQGRYLFFAYGTTLSLERDNEHHASRGAAWFQVALPTIGYDLSLAAVQRWRPGAFDTDLAVRYALDREGFEPFIGVDVVNLFERADARVYRASFGVRH